MLFSEKGLYRPTADTGTKFEKIFQTGFVALPAGATGILLRKTGPNSQRKEALLRKATVICMNQKLIQYQNDIRGKHVAVIGLGISNTPVIDFLLEAGAIVSGRDKKKRETLGPIADTLTEKGVTLILGDGYLQNITEDILYKSPGIRPDLPEFVDAVERGAVLTSEMEVFFDLCPATLFAVTGSDGKTTTTTLIYTILTAQCEKDAPEGKTGRVYVGGNIGAPLLPLVGQMTEEDYAVVELSSFQLQTMHASPHVACITNVTPNHLNWHTDMEEYTQAKENVFRYQTKGDRVILNYENDLTREMADRATGHVTLFSSKHTLTPGPGVDAVIYEADGMICLATDPTNPDAEPFPILATADIAIPGRHNVENYMTAIGAVRGYADPDTITEVARTFSGVAHRQQFICERGGVKYYNSSIDSSPTRTIAALLALSGSIVILGGYDKHIPFAPLAKPLRAHAKAVVLTGAARDTIRTALESDPDFLASGIPMVTVPDFFEAIDAARDLARPGDTVLLSPACASFDAFPNFEKRGEAFAGHVLAYE